MGGLNRFIMEFMKPPNRALAHWLPVMITVLMGAVPAIDAERILEALCNLDAARKLASLTGRDVPEREEGW